jgi:hypothetical protein
MMRLQKIFVQAQRSDFRDQMSAKTKSYKRRLYSHSDTSDFLQSHLIWEALTSINNHLSL